MPLAEGAPGTADEGLYIADVPTDSTAPGQYSIVVDAARDEDDIVLQIDQLHPGFGRYKA